jgi:hypothetical protein
MSSLALLVTISNVFISYPPYVLAFGLNGLIWGFLISNLGGTIRFFKENTSEAGTKRGILLKLVLFILIPFSSALMAVLAVFLYRCRKFPPEIFVFGLTGWEFNYWWILPLILALSVLYVLAVAFRNRDKKLVYAAILLLLVFTIIPYTANNGLWLGATCESPTITASGFSKIKPQTAGVGLSSKGDFIGIFTNGVGSRINVSLGDVVVQSSNGITCVPEQGFSSVLAGKNFQINQSGCEKGKPGEPYMLRVLIPYTVTLQNITTTHTEIGMIRGPFE